MPAPAVHMIPLPGRASDAADDAAGPGAIRTPRTTPCRRADAGGRCSPERTPNSACGGGTAAAAGNAGAPQSHPCTPRRSSLEGSPPKLAQRLTPGVPGGAGSPPRQTRTGSTPGSSTAGGSEAKGDAALGVRPLARLAPGSTSAGGSETKGDVTLCVRLRPAPLHTDVCAVVESKDSASADSKDTVRLRSAAATAAGTPLPAALVGRHDVCEVLYRCDYAFGPQASQEQVYNKAVCPIAEAVIRGYNGAVIAYGQTGAGKTHTMVGTRTRDGQGVAPRAVADIFAALAGRASWMVAVSALEIYNERARDLLAPGGGTTAVEIHEVCGPEEPPSQGQVFRCPDATMRPARTPAEALAALSEGVKRRETASTDMNHHSSRSHLVFTISVWQSAPEDCATRSSPEGTTLHSRLHLVDLAGSERLKRAQNGAGATAEPPQHGSATPAAPVSGRQSLRGSGASTPAAPLSARQGQRLSLGGGATTSRPTSVGPASRPRDQRREAVEINKSLSHLALVIQRLTAAGPPQYVPYRDTMLTRLLAESFGGSSKTCLIINCSPLAEDREETRSSLDFGRRAKLVRNKPRINVESKSQPPAVVKAFMQTLGVQAEPETPRSRRASATAITVPAEAPLVLTVPPPTRPPASLSPALPTSALAGPTEPAPTPTSTAMPARTEALPGQLQPVDAKEEPQQQAAQTAFSSAASPATAVQMTTTVSAVPTTPASPAAPAALAAPGVPTAPTTPEASEASPSAAPAALVAPAVLVAPEAPVTPTASEAPTEPPLPTAPTTPATPAAPTAPAAPTTPTANMAIAGPPFAWSPRWLAARRADEEEASATPTAVAAAAATAAGATAAARAVERSAGLWGRLRAEDAFSHALLAPSPAPLLPPRSVPSEPSPPSPAVAGTGEAADPGAAAESPMLAVGEDALLRAALADAAQARAEALALRMQLEAEICEKRQLRAQLVMLQEQNCALPCSSSRRAAEEALKLEEEKAEAMARFEEQSLALRLGWQDDVARLEQEKAAAAKRLKTALTRRWQEDVARLREAHAATAASLEADREVMRCEWRDALEEVHCLRRQQAATEARLEEQCTALLAAAGAVATAAIPAAGAAPPTSPAVSTAVGRAALSPESAADRAAAAATSSCRLAWPAPPAAPSDAAEEALLQAVPDLRIAAGAQQARQADCVVSAPALHAEGPRPSPKWICWDEEAAALGGADVAAGSACGSPLAQLGGAGTGMAAERLVANEPATRVP